MRKKESQSCVTVSWLLWSQSRAQVVPWMGVRKAAVSLASRTCPVHPAHTGCNLCMSTTGQDVFSVCFSPLQLEPVLKLNLRIKNKKYHKTKPKPFWQMWHRCMSLNTHSRVLPHFHQMKCLGSCFSQDSLAFIELCQCMAQTWYLNHPSGENLNLL